MPANDPWSENRDLLNDNQRLRAANDELVWTNTNLVTDNRNLNVDKDDLKRANTLLRADLNEERRKTHDYHAKFTHRCKVVEDLEGENQVLKKEKNQEIARLSEMLKAQVAENRQLVVENQRLQAEGRELKSAKTSEVELNQTKSKLVELTAYTNDLKKARDTAYVKMAEAEHKQLAAQGELKRIKVELAELHKSAKELAELKQAMSERLKSVAAQNKGLTQEVLEFKKKRPLEVSYAKVVADPISQAGADLRTKNDELTKAITELSTENEILKSYNGDLEERLDEIHRMSCV